MVRFQVWLEALLRSAKPVATFMHMHWSWPGAESVHFIGLTLLFGSIAAWDLRLLGLARRVPVGAFHRLVPFAILGFTLNIASGSLFLMTEPDQYIYNPAFHLKVLCLLLAGVNVLVFYVTLFRRVNMLGPGEQPPVFARMSGAVSLVLWTMVIICGRMLTFYRPIECRAAEAVTWLADCTVR